MLYPSRPLLLISAFVIAAALASWKGGWKGGVTAMMMSALIAVAMFALPAMPLLTMLAASIAVSGIAQWRPAPKRVEVVVENNVADDDVVEDDSAAREEAARIAAEDERRKREERELRAAEQRARQEADRAEALRREAERLEAERLAIEQRAREEAKRVEAERLLEEENANAAGRAQELAAELRAAAEDAQRLNVEMETRLAGERAKLHRELEATLQRRVEEELQKQAPPRTPPPQSLFGTIAGWFDRKPAPKMSISRPRRSSAPPKLTVKEIAARPRLLLFEKRRATADTIVPKLRQRGIIAEVVERVVDAADEIHRFRPDALLIDSELAEFDKEFDLLAKENPKLPTFVTGRSFHDFVPPPSLHYVAFVARPYDVDELSRIARDAHDRPDQLLAPRVSGDAPSPHVAQRAGSGYDVMCASCRVVFDAMDGDWCSCIARDRTIVCTNCLTCFCKAPQTYKEQFWSAAPQALVDRRANDAQRIVLPINPEVNAVKRPLVLSIESDPAIQQTIQRVCANLGYGFVHAANAQDGVTLAHVFAPELVITGAAPPPPGDAKVVVIGENPVALTELINLLQRHLEGATAL